MPDITILTEAELRSQVQLDQDAIDCVEQAFLALATRAVVMPPIMRLDIVEHSGEIDVKTAYIPGIDSLAIKISPGFFDNPKLGLPSVNGLMVVFSTRTGLVEALLLDNGYLTDVRTAAAGAVAAKQLARADSKRAAIIGSGVQARLQLEALTLVRPIETATIWGREADKAAAAAREMTERLGIPVSASPTVAAATSGADIVVTTTPATAPLLLAGHVEPGQHITAMGSDAEHKNEIDPAVVAGSVRYFCDRLSQARVLGELHHAIERGLVSADTDFAEIGQVIAGQEPGRGDDREVTLCDLTGTGIQDTAIATLAVRRCAQNRAGTRFTT